MTIASIEERATNAAGRVAAAAGGLASDARTQARQFAGQATGAAEDAYGLARQQVRGAAASVATSVERQPLTTLLATGLVCGLLGFLLARR